MVHEKWIPPERDWLADEREMQRIEAEGDLAQTIREQDAKMKARAAMRIDSTPAPRASDVKRTYPHDRDYKDTPEAKALGDAVDAARKGLHTRDPATLARIIKVNQREDSLMERDAYSALVEVLPGRFEWIEYAAARWPLGTDKVEPLVFTPDPKALARYAIVEAREAFEKVLKEQHDEHEARFKNIAKGDTVEVVRGRKHLGVVGKLCYLGRDKFTPGAMRAGILPDDAHAGAKLVFVDASYVERPRSKEFGARDAVAKLQMRDPRWINAKNALDAALTNAEKIGAVVA
jgi:hypothetical protein